MYFFCKTRVLLPAVLLLLLPALCMAGHGHDRPQKTGILLAFFGTSVPSAQTALDSFMERARAAHPDVELRRAWTSSVVREKLRRTTGQAPFGVVRALAQMAEDGFTHVAVQSLHTIPGHEFDDLRAVVDSFRRMPDAFEQLSLGKPLLWSDRDMKTIARALIDTHGNELDPDAALVFMGHGTHHPSGAFYAALQFHLSRMAERVFMGTVEGSPSLRDIRQELQQAGVRRVRLVPFMSVAGDHAMNDMAGPQDDSWASILRAEGYEVECVLQGTADNPAIAGLWLEHLELALKHLQFATDELDRH